MDFLRSDGGAPRPLTLLLGANGSGKTSVLQAVALVISLATRKIAEPGAFAWPGFLLERVSSGGRTRIELELGFSEVERHATVELFNEWRGTVRAEITREVAPPANESRINLIYEDGILRCEQGQEALAQCLGRYFIRTIIRTHPWLRRRFRDVGDVFWFDQHRNLLALSTKDTPGLEGLRQFLITWYAFHTSPRRNPDQVDYLPQLEAKFSRVFPGTTIFGVEPRPGLTSSSTADTYFLLQNEGRTYDLAEMSSGEQAVFPLIYEFVRLDIASSVVLVDELELHLHPPQQQTLLTSLRHIGPDCQFVLTSHSPYLESAVPDEEEIRLEGGLRCL